MRQKGYVFVLMAAVGLGACALAPRAEAGVASKVAREVAEYILKKFGKKAVKGGVEALAQRLDDLAKRYGDDVLEAAKKAGPRAIDAMEDAGALAPTAAKYLAKYGDDALAVVGNRRALRLASEFGDDAARALIKHPGLAEDLISKHGIEAARGLVKLKPHQARRLAMMERSGELRRMGRTGELLNVIERFGDRAMNFVWRHKKSLMVAALLAKFLQDPEPFINGVKDLAAEVTKAAAAVGGRAVESVGHVAAEGVREAARGTNWTVVLLGVPGIAAAYFVLRGFRASRRAAAPVSNC